MLNTMYQYVSFKSTSNAKYKGGQEYNRGSTTFDGKELLQVLAVEAQKFPNGFNVTLSWDQDRVATNKNGGKGVSGRLSCYEPKKKE
jgi:hypothetical protein